jgi:hypothetical protein
LAKRLWVASQALHKAPWELLGLGDQPTEAWLDWVVIMASKHPPGSLKFERRSEDAMVYTSPHVAWDNVLTGKARERFHDKLVSPTLREKLRRASGRQ